MQYYFDRRNVPMVYKNPKAHVIHASYLDKDEFVQMPRAFHRHDNALELVLALSGSTLAIIDGKPWTVNEGDIIIYNKKSYHQECANQSQDFSLYCIAAAGIQLPGLPEDCICGNDGPMVIHTLDDFKLFETLFSRIFDIVRIGDVKQTALLDNYLNVLLGEVIMRHEQQREYSFENTSSYKSLPEEILEWLTDHYNEKITLQDVADALSISPDYVSHSFKDHFGYSPMNYVNTIRIGQAQLRLIETDDKISDIAMDVGFNNIGNFNRAFLELTGRAPRNFRNTHITLKKQFNSKESVSGKPHVPVV